MRSSNNRKSGSQEMRKVSRRLNGWCWNDIARQCIPDQMSTFCLIGFFCSPCFKRMYTCTRKHLRK